MNSKYMSNYPNAIWFQTKHLPSIKYLDPDANIRALKAAVTRCNGRFHFEVIFLQNHRSNGTLVEKGQARSLKKAMKAVFFRFDNWGEDDLLR